MPGPDVAGADKQSDPDAAEVVDSTDTENELADVPEPLWKQFEADVADLVAGADSTAKARPRSAAGVMVDGPVQASGQVDQRNADRRRVAVPHEDLGDVGDERHLKRSSEASSVGRKIRVPTAPLLTLLGVAVQSG